MIQNLQQLKNLLSPQNNSKATNLIPKDLQSSNVNQTSEERLTNFLLTISIILSLSAGIIIFLNFSLEEENNRIELGLNNSLSLIENESNNKKEIENRIKIIQKFNQLSQNRSNYKNFINFTEKVFTYLQTRNVLSLNFVKEEKNINFKISYNSKDQNSFTNLKNLLSEEKALKEIKLVSSKFYQDLSSYQFEIEGIYESR